MSESNVLNSTGRRLCAAASNDIVSARSLARELGATLYVDERERWQHLPFRAMVLAGPDAVAALRAVADCGLYEVEARELKPGPASTVGVFPMVPHPQMSAADADRHWHKVHGPLALHHHAAMTNYTQLAVVEQLAGPVQAGPAIAGIALCGFSSLADLRERFFSHADSREVIGADIARFADLKRSPPRLIATVETFS